MFEKIIDDNYELTEREVVGYIQQVCQGLKFMHNKSIIHLDIKVILTYSNTALKTLTCTFKNAESLQCQKPKCQKLLLSQKLNFVDFRHFKTCAFRVLSMVN